MIAYTSISSARVVTLPSANSLPPGFILTIQDESGSASSTNTISVKRQGTDQINRSSANVVAVNTAYGGGTAETNGVSQWTVRQYPTGSSTTGTNGQSTLGSPYTVTAGYANTGLSITLPNAGTYKVTCQASSTVTTPGAAGDNIQLKLRNTTDAVDVGLIGQGAYIELAAAISASATTTLDTLVTTSGASKVIALQATAVGTAMGYSVTIALINYVQIA